MSICISWKVTIIINALLTLGSVMMVLFLFNKADRPCSIAVFMHSQSHNNFLLQQANSDAGGNGYSNIAIRRVTDLQKNIRNIFF